MPVYNGQDYVAEAIRSILDQTYPHFEFIIINDGSSDGSEKLIRSFEDKRILYINNTTNLGLIASLNLGLKRAKGQFIARMDHDDTALPNRLEEQLLAFRKQKDLVAVGTYYYLVKGGSEKRSLSHWSEESDYLKTVLLFSTCFAHPTVMMKNVFSGTELGYDAGFKHTEDYRLWTELSDLGAFYNIPKPLLRYRVHPSQTTVLNRKSQYQLSEQIRKDYLDRLGFNYSEQQLEVHNQIGNNAFVRSESGLKEMASWLEELVKQNSEKQTLAKTPFNLAIHKFWIEICGNTNLGLTAFRAYSGSPLSTLSRVSFSLKVKLLVKCILRGMKN